MDWGNWSRCYTGIVVVLVGLCCYLNTLNSDFVYDDSRAIQNNTDLRSTTPWVNLLYNDFWGTPLKHSGSHKSYRPLCVASFRLNYAVHGLNPAAYHATNAILHCAVCLLVVAFCYAMLLSHRACLIGGLLFATHPIHTEAVAGIVGRADIGACFFFLAALLSYISACSYQNSGLENATDVTKTTKWGWLLASLVFSAASMLTKEQGVTVLGVCAVFEFVLVSRINFQCFKASVRKAVDCGLIGRLLSLTVTLLCLLCLRFFLMGNKTPDFSNSDNPAANSDSLLTRSLTFIYLPAFNFWLLLCPATLSFDWSMDAIPLVHSVFDWRNLFSLTFYSCLLVLGISALKKVNLENFSKVFIELNANYKGLGPECARIHNGLNGTNAIRKRTINRSKQNVQTTLKERRKIPETKAQPSIPSDEVYTSYDCQLFLVSMAILILPFVPACNLFFYVGFVVAERVLYIPSVGYCVMVAIGLELLLRCCSSSCRRWIMGCIFIMLVMFAAKTVNRNLDWKDGETLYRSGIDVNPAKAWANLGTILSGKGKITEAELAYRKALTYRSNMADTHYNLGVLLADRKQYQDAVVCYQYAIAYRPTLALAHLNLGIALEHLGRHNDAAKVLRNATTLSEHGLKDPKAHIAAVHKIKYNLGRILAERGKLKEAFEVYHDAVRTLPDHVEPHSLYNMIGEAYNKVGSKDEAEKWYKMSIQSKPDHVPAHLTLAKHYGKTNRVQDAMRLFKRAQRLSPNDHSVWTHVGQFLYEQKNIAGAAEMFEKASHLKRDDFDIAFTAANYLREAGKKEKSREFFTKAAKIDPQNPIAHMNLGAIHHLLGDYVQGEQSYLMALSLKPGDEMTQENLKKLRALKSKKTKKT